jgi:hypothetical protein
MSFTRAGDLLGAWRLESAVEVFEDGERRDEFGPSPEGYLCYHPAVLVPALDRVAGAAQVAQVRRTVTRKGKKTVEVVYLMTSDRDADPAALAARVRGHREIETGFTGSAT